MPDGADGKKNTPTNTYHKASALTMPGRHVKADFFIYHYELIAGDAPIIS